MVDKFRKCTGNQGAPFVFLHMVDRFEHLPPCCFLYATLNLPIKLISIIVNHYFHYRMASGHQVKSFMSQNMDSARYELQGLQRKVEKRLNIEPIYIVSYIILCRVDTDQNVIMFQRHLRVLKILPYKYPPRDNIIIFLKRIQKSLTKFHFYVIISKSYHNTIEHPNQWQVHACTFFES